MSIRILALLAILALAGCDLFRSHAKTIGADVVDCTKAEVVKAAGELGPAIRPLVVSAVAGEASWASLAAYAKSWSLELGGCVLASVVTDLEKVVRAAPKTLAQQIDPVALREGAKRLLVERFGNAYSWRTKDGDL